MSPTEVNSALRLGLKVIPPVGTIFYFDDTMRTPPLYVVVECDGHVLSYKRLLKALKAVFEVGLWFFWEHVVVVELPTDCPPFDQWVRVE